MSRSIVVSNLHPETKGSRIESGYKLSVGKLSKVWWPIAANQNK